MNTNCNCNRATPPAPHLPTENRPGLDALTYRVGTQATFLETMKARLASADFPELAGLSTRESDDPAIALLDGWATVADVLTFYQERLANEGFLRTARERRSVLELAQLVGYAPRPGVAASTYLAYTLDSDRSVTPPRGFETVIPAGSRAQSVPGAGELPQTFETERDLKARTEWNTLKPRLTRPQPFDQVPRVIYLKGVTANIKPGDPLVVVDAQSRSSFQRVKKVEVDRTAQHTKVTLQIKGDFEAEVAELAELAAKIPALEEEGPYSKAIGDAANQKIADHLHLLLTRLGTAKPVWADLLEEAKILDPLVEQTARILSLLHFDLLAVWANSVRACLRRLAERLAERTGTATPEAPAWALDDGCLAAIQNWNKNSAKALPKTAYASKLIKSELGKARARLERLASWEKKTTLKPEVEATILCLRQLAEVATSLRCAEQGKWLRELCATLEKAVGGVAAPGPAPSKKTSVIELAPKVGSLLARATVRTSSAASLLRKASAIYSRRGAFGLAATAAMDAKLGRLYEAALRGTTVPPSPAHVYVLRTKAALFGHNAALSFTAKDGTITDLTEHTLDGEKSDTVFLDADYDGIAPDGYVAIQTPGLFTDAQVLRVVNASAHPRSAYGLSTKTTEIRLDSDWWDPADALKTKFAVIRGTAVLAQSEELELAEEPIDSEIEGDSIELDQLCEGLEPGRWLIVSGERADIEDTSGNPVTGVQFLELAMLSALELESPEATENDAKASLPVPGTKLHSTLRLAQPLAYRYKRDTVTICGNVVPATHGETRQETLGNGDGSKPLQAFTLKQSPLTFLAAATPSGVLSTLAVRVNDVLWHETDWLAGAGPTDHRFVARIDDDAKTSVVFGNGIQGARPPTGLGNITARYRSGIGRLGNVQAGQINLLGTRPLGVKEVVNPLAATGGADAETRDQARRNAPLAVAALDRLVSVQDYADFARTFAGIGRANAVRLPVGRHQLIHVTVAGAADIPIDETSSLYTRLLQALRAFGEPDQPIGLAVRELVLLVVSARIRVKTDYLWEKVEPRVRAAVLEAFGFERRELGQAAVLGELIAAMQAVDGVDWVDVDAFAGVSGLDNAGRPLAPDKIADAVRTAVEKQAGIPPPVVIAQLARTSGDQIRPAQLALFSPLVADTIVLREATS